LPPSEGEELRAQLHSKLHGTDRAIAQVRRAFVEVAPKAQPLRLLETSVLLAPIENKESEISMMSMSWLLWMAFMFLFLVPSISYGWGYRKWGRHTRGISSGVVA